MKLLVVDDKAELTHSVFLNNVSGCMYSLMRLALFLQQLLS